MVSRAQRNVIAILGICAGLGVTIRNELYLGKPPKTMEAMLVKLEAACMDGHKCWPGDLERKDIEKITMQLVGIDRDQFAKGGIVASTSVCLGLLSDAMEHVKDMDRGAALDLVHQRMFSIFRYFDKRWNKWEAYAIASRALRNWEESAA